MHRVIMLAVVVLASAAALAQTQPPRAPVRPGSSPTASTPDPNQPRPIDALDTVFMEDMTWMEVRDAMRAGKTTAIIATGGIEQSGPYLALGKHNVVLRATCDVIARKLGNALVAPIIGLVPEGDYDPPSGHMKYPGTVGVRPETFKAILTDVAAVMKAHGFAHVILLGDHGANPPGMKEVAETLARQWAGSRTTIHVIPEYYDYDGATRFAESLGVHEVDEGLHDDFVITSIMATVNPDSIRARQRMAKGKFSINGVGLAPLDKTVAIGKKIVDYRANVTVEAIRKALAKTSATQ
jgi:creatinine amidohydrolase